MVKGIGRGATCNSLRRGFILKNLAGTAPTAADARFALVQRTVASRIFQKSARQREFLVYIAQCAVENRLDDVTEQAIGHHVFGRPAGYEPAEDNIVRVAARQLRLRLREYFETEGRDEAVVIEIPKGGYVPVFRPREAAEPAPLPFRRSVPLWAVTVLAVALLAPLAALWRQNRTLQRELKAKEPLANPLMAVLKGSPSGRITFAIVDSTFAELTNFVGKTSTLEDYAARRFPVPPDSGRWTGAREFFEGFVPKKLTSIADVEMASKIMRSAGEHRVDVRLRHARDLIVRDFHSDNVIISGGPRTNPWLQLFESTLNFRFEIDPATHLREIVNHSPAPGESPLYSDGDPKPGASYARVAVVPNLGRSGKVVLIGGIKPAATEAAGDFMVDPAALPAVHSALRVSDLSALESFELLLEIHDLDGTPRQARLLAWRLGRRQAR
jgi:hypothetical protein